MKPDTRLPRLAIIALAISLGCRSQPSPVETVRWAELREAKAKWAAKGPLCYELTESWTPSATGLAEPVGEWNVTVCHDKVVNATSESEQPPEELRYIDELLRTGEGHFSEKGIVRAFDTGTVDGLFADLEREVLRDPRENDLAVEYDPHAGFPTKISTWSLVVTDGGWGVNVRRLSPFDCSECTNRGSPAWNNRRFPSDR